MKNLALYRQQGATESIKSLLALCFIIVIWFFIRNLDWKLIEAVYKGPIHQTWAPVVQEAVKVRINTVAMDLKAFQSLKKLDLS